MRREYIEYLGRGQTPGVITLDSVQLFVGDPLQGALPDAVAIDARECIPLSRIQSIDCWREYFAARKRARASPSRDAARTLFIPRALDRRASSGGALRGAPGASAYSGLHPIFEGAFSTIAPAWDNKSAARRRRAAGAREPLRARAKSD
jgi:hypothetical protein